MNLYMDRMGITFPQSNPHSTPWLIHFCKAEVSLVQVPPSWQNFSAVKVSLCSSFTFKRGLVSSTNPTKGMMVIPKRPGKIWEKTTKNSQK